MTEFIKFEKEVPKYLTLAEDKPELKQGTYGQFYVWKCEEGDIKVTVPLAGKMKDLGVGKGDKIVIEKKTQSEHPERTYFSVERYTQQKDTEVDSDLKEAEKTPPTGDLAKLIAELEHLVDKYKVPF